MTTVIGYGANSQMRRGSGWSSTSEFDDFLSASVGEDRHGAVSVISMLGRLNIDPRQEALKLSALPRPAATRRLALLIESLPDRLLSAADATAIAALLAARLPQRKKPLELAAVPARALGLPPTFSPWMLILVTAAAILLGVALFS